MICGMQNKHQNNGSESSQFQLNYILQSPNLAGNRIQFVMFKSIIAQIGAFVTVHG